MASACRLLAASVSADLTCLDADLVKGPALGIFQCTPLRVNRARKLGGTRPIDKLCTKTAVGKKSIREGRRWQKDIRNSINKLGSS